MEFETAKKLFVIGLILQPVGIIWLPLTLLGLVLSLVGIYHLSKHFGRSDIFRKYLFFFILTILIGTPFSFGLVTAYLALSMLPSLLSYNYYKNLPQWSTILLILLFTILIGNMFLVPYSKWKVYMGLAEIGSTRYFKTAATLVWIGTMTFFAFLLLFFEFARLPGGGWWFVLWWFPPVYSVGYLVFSVMLIIGDIFAIIGAFKLKRSSPYTRPKGLV